MEPYQRPHVMSASLARAWFLKGPQPGPSSLKSCRAGRQLLADAAAGRAGSYSLSKLCNAMHALELARRLAAAHPHVTVNTLDPGRAAPLHRASEPPHRESTGAGAGGGAGGEQAPQARVCGGLG